MLDFWKPVFVIWVFSVRTTCGRYNLTIGGSRLPSVPNEILVVLSLDETIFDYDQKPDCVGVYIGGFDRARDRSIALTSPYCHINPWAEVRSARQEILRGNPITHYGYDDFGIAIIQLEIPRGYWPPEINDIVGDKNEFRKHMSKGTKDNTTYGIGMAVHTNPMKAYTVTLNQTYCAAMFRKLRMSSWPEKLPEGGFCVFPGREPAWIEHGEPGGLLLPGIPCEDATGSPILISDLTKVLGIIIRTFCEETRVAFAISPAFLTDVIIPTLSTTTELATTTTSATTEPPPPLPRVPATSRPCADSSTKIYHLQLRAIVLLFGLLGIW